MLLFECITYHKSTHHYIYPCTPQNKIKTIIIQKLQKGYV
jgi:hypothetical protein